jgi:hypothetical protein
MPKIDDTQHYSDCITGHGGHFEGVQMPDDPDTLICVECYAAVKISPPCNVIDLTEAIKGQLLGLN